MTRIYLPDTNVFSVFGQRRHRSLARLFLEHAADLCLSSLVWYELRYGALNKPDEPVFEARLETLREIIPEITPWDEEAAWHSARLRVEMKKRRPTISLSDYDLLIAGHALSLGAILVTNDQAFARVPGLLVENWQVE